MLALVKDLSTKYLKIETNIMFRDENEDKILKWINKQISN